MHQHLEQGLVTDALACREFSRLQYVGFGQSQRDLNAGSPVQFADKARPVRRAPPLRRAGRFLLQKLATLATCPPVRLFPFIPELRHVNLFHSHRFIPLAAVGPSSPSSARHPDRTLDVAQFPLHTLVPIEHRSSTVYATPDNGLVQVISLGFRVKATHRGIEKP